MKLLIVSAAPLIYKDQIAFAYAPYVNELIILEKFVDDVTFSCPVWESEKDLLIAKIPFSIKKYHKLVDFNLNSFVNVCKSVFSSLYNIFVLFKVMKKADHIHLRCPGNIGLLACFVQIFFPNKHKTAKYAGNWDPKSKQPITYKIQKWILNNTFLTKNMQVLVYGDWKNQSKNIKPFFTATYSKNEIENIDKPGFNHTIKFIFVGSLVSGKNPMYAITLIHELIANRYKISLDLYGEGIQRISLENFIEINGLGEFVTLHGNQNAETLKKAYQESHFVILPSKSEGWPKAIAEGMFWGCVPIASKVSCIPFMMDYGNRGIMLEMDVKKDKDQLKEIFKNEKTFFVKSELASNWSQNYTTDVFESEIKKLLVK